MRKHHELKAWQDAIELVKEIYRVTRDFPKEEIYGLVSQICLCGTQTGAPCSHIYTK